jgi:hypothetical protein
MKMETGQKMREKGLHVEKECSFEQEVSVGNLDQKSRLQIKKEQAGWKGSASRSAFHPNEPQTTSDLQHPMFKNALCDAVKKCCRKAKAQFLRYRS